MMLARRGWRRRAAGRLARLSPPLVVAFVSALLAVGLLQWRHANMRLHLRRSLMTSQQMQDARLLVTRAYLIVRQTREGDQTFDRGDAAEQLELATLAVSSWLSRRDLPVSMFGRVQRDPELRRLITAYEQSIARFRTQLLDPAATDVQVRTAFTALEREADAIAYRLQAAAALRAQRDARDHAFTVFLLTFFILVTGFALHEVASRRNEVRGALVESESRLRLVMDQMPILSWTTDRTLCVRSAFGALLPLIGGLPEDVIGRRLHDLLVVTTEADTVLAAHAEALAGRHASYDIDVGDRHMAVGVDPLRDHAGEVIGVVAVAIDVTERQRLETQLHQAQKMEAIGRLAGGVAHDFNNLLTVIRMNAHILMDGLDAGDPLRRDAQQIDTAGERGARLIRQLLAVSRQQPQQRTVLDLGQLAREMAPMLRQLVGERNTLHVHVAPGPARVSADQSQLEQVVMNLVTNARDAMPEGGRVSIEVAAASPELVDGARALQPGSYVALRVADSGIGMDEATRARIFDPFFTTRAEGHGLGLATVYGIVQQSGGTIHVDSTPGEGTTFLVLLPSAAVA